jgi:hypothetical protein
VIRVFGDLLKPLGELLVEALGNGSVHPSLIEEPRAALGRPYGIFQKALQARAFESAARARPEKQAGGRPATAGRPLPVLSYQVI